ncbi:MAG: type II toxin-antitoxin system RelE/ParE family toxin [Ectothiorhodospiraceae bacterium]|nr:type II toxin-antitoxin system RelE/ParE family toxin [Ectothiorhodospiraceae bacterium]
MKKYPVILTSKAEQDIEDIYDYIAKKDMLQNAECVLDKLEALILALDETPERGTYPPELSRQGINEFREVIFKPYRAIYQIFQSKVIVHLCVDGRRDMVALLERRLLR